MKGKKNTPPTANVTTTSRGETAFAFGLVASVSCWKFKPTMPVDDDAGTSGCDSVCLSYRVALG